jgi:hypothetical protein
MHPSSSIDRSGSADGACDAGWRESHIWHVRDALLAHRNPPLFRERVPDILDGTVPSGRQKKLPQNGSGVMLNRVSAIAIAGVAPVARPVAAMADQLVPPR